MLTIYISATSIGTFGSFDCSIYCSSSNFPLGRLVGAIICGATLIVIIFGCEETVFDRQLYTKVLESENVTQIPDPSEEKKQDNPLTNNTIPHEKKNSMEQELSHEYITANNNEHDVVPIDPETLNEKKILLAKNSNHYTSTLFTRFRI